MESGKILVLGSSGALGTAIGRVVNEEKNGKWDYTGLDHRDFEITEKDKLERIINEVTPDVIVNSVAVIGANYCENNIAKTFEINSFAVNSIAKICNDHDILFIQPSSHAVFYGDKYGHYTEGDIPKPRGIYAVSKFAAESFAAGSKRHYVVRFPTMFGTRKNNSLGFVDKMILGLVKGQELKVPDDKIDSPTYTLDAARQLMWMIDEKVESGTYHITNNGCGSYFDVVERIRNLINSKSNIIKCKESDFPAITHKPLRTAMASTKLPVLRGWKEALDDYVSNEVMTDKRFY